MLTPRPGKSRTDVEIGMVLMALAALLIPGSDAIAKWLSASLSPAQIAWGRFLVQTLLLLPVLLVTGRRIRVHRLWAQALRGVILAGAIMCLFWALKYLPMANAIAVFFVEPLVLTVLSGLFLGEPIGRRRLAAVVVGLIGALVVIRPNWAAFGWATLLPLGAAVCFAGYLALTRHAAAGDEPLAMQFWAGVFAALALTVALGIGSATSLGVLAPAWPGPAQWLLLLGVGAISTLVHVLMAFAFGFAPAGILAPFQYLEIISATTLGLLVFGDFPDAVTLAGIVLIVGSGLYVFQLERGNERLRRSPPATTD